MGQNPTLVAKRGGGLEFIAPRLDHRTDEDARSLYASIRATSTDELVAFYREVKPDSDSDIVGVPRFEAESQLDWVKFYLREMIHAVVTERLTDEDLDAFEWDV